MTVMDWEKSRWVGDRRTACAISEDDDLVQGWVVYAEIVVKRL